MIFPRRLLDFIPLLIRGLHPPDLAIAELAKLLQSANDGPVGVITLSGFEGLTVSWIAVGRWMSVLGIQ
jgi:hypothetical protein